MVDRFIVTCVVASSLFAVPVAAAQVEAGGAGKGRTDVAYGVAAGHVPLLERFLIGYRSPHHINAIMVMPAGAAEDESPNAGIGMPSVEEGNLAVMLQDKNADDTYDFTVWHQTFPNLTRHNIRDVGCQGRCERQLPHPNVVGGNVFVLVGFQLFFTGGRDHHIDQIGVFEEDGKLVLVYSDKNGDDVFGYSVDYALVPRLRIQELDSYDVGVGGGWGATTVQSGIKVLRGFHVDFKAGAADRHFEGIDIGFSGDLLRILYSDGSSGAFDAVIDWAVMQSGAVIDP